MTSAQLSPTAQKVFDLLRQNAGTPYAASDVCEALDCSPSQAQAALEMLAHAGMIDRQESPAGTDTFVAR